MHTHTHFYVHVYLKIARFALALVLSGSLLIYISKASAWWERELTILEAPKKNWELHVFGFCARSLAHSLSFGRFVRLLTEYIISTAPWNESGQTAKCEYMFMCVCGTINCPWNIKPNSPEVIERKEIML